MPILRHDLKPNGTVIPASVKRALGKFGGKNPYDENIYRLIRAEDRIIKAPGEWAIWPEHLSLDDRGGLALDVLQKALMLHRAKIEEMLVHDSLHEIEKVAKRFNAEFEELLQARLNAAPSSVVRGMMEVALYPYEGFIIEKWYPAEHSGSPEDWNALTFDGMPAAGPYPQYGDYELLAGPTPYMPTIDELEEAIRKNFRDIQTRPRSSKERVRLLMEKVDMAAKQKDKDVRAHVDAFRKDTGALMNRLSLGAGRVRQDLAKRSGLKGHYGN